MGGTSRKNILFLCRDNSARSIIAEAIANRISRGQIEAFSAGSDPSGKVNPHALELLMDLGYETAALHSKDLDVFTRPGAPVMDFVIAICEHAASIPSPAWPGHPANASWSMPDPAAIKGSRTKIRSAFADVYRLLEQRIAALTEEDLSALDSKDIERRLRDIELKPGIHAFSL